jgi:hypothetical protein
MTSRQPNDDMYDGAQRAHSTPDPDEPPTQPTPSPFPDDVPDPAHAPVEEPRFPEPPIRT